MRTNSRSRVRTWPLATALLVFSTAPLWAAGACTDVLHLDDTDGASDDTCLAAIIRDAAKSGYRAQAWDDETHSARFAIGKGIVITRCVKGDSVAFSAFHADADEACALIERIRDAITE